MYEKEIKLELKGKIALVTGGSEGYGKGIAKALKNEGCRVWIMGRNNEKLKDAASEINVNYFKGDITDTKDWDSILGKITAAGNGIDILINNAGRGIAIKPLVEQSDEEVEQSLKVNLLGHIFGIMRTARIMIKQRSGIIINISSVCAEHAWPAWSVYSAAKAGIEQLAKSLHNELRVHNVHITTVTPSWGATSFAAASNLPGMDKDIEKKMMKPLEMGELIVRICSMPDHLVLPKVRVQPMIQEINPM